MVKQQTSKPVGGPSWLGSISHEVRLIVLSTCDSSAPAKITLVSRPCNHFLYASPTHSPSQFSHIIVAISPLLPLHDSTTLFYI